MPRSIALIAPDEIVAGASGLMALSTRRWQQASFLTPELPLQLPQLPQSYFSTPEGIKCRDKVNTTLTEDDKKGAADDYTLHHLEKVATAISSICKRAIQDLEGDPAERLAKIQAGVESLF
ncbi:unnamed protein product [Cladocopium goreaui]|uniref:Uncharacterized protein n=1 Tax=Cladocopium goreaui TaxID=2562237 RepID=A0A9P1DBG4_9DINO|nr:unnamed protein product [Cladocopium goreaui]